MPVLEEVQVPFEYHKFIIGQRGRDVRKLMQDFDVNISIPPADEQSDVVKVRGPPANVSRAKDAIAERVVQLEQEKEDRVSCNQQLFMCIICVGLFVYDCKRIRICVWKRKCACVCVHAHVHVNERERERIKRKMLIAKFMYGM